LTSAPGIILAGLGYGLVESFVAGYVSTRAREIVGFGLVIACSSPALGTPRRKALETGVRERLGWILLVSAAAVIPLLTSNTY